METIYFFYGLAFFSLGITILVYPKDRSDSPLAQTVSYIAFFGIIHGITEWMQMVHINNGQTGGIAPYAGYANLLTLSISYLFLVLFWVKNMYTAKMKKLKALPAILCIALILISWAGKWDYLSINIWSRYILGMPGIFLTSYVLFSQSRLLMTKSPSAAIHIRIAAGAFFFYGIFSGLIVPEAGFFPASVINEAAYMNMTGIPVQVFRTACAILICYGMISMLNIFNIETREKLRELSLKDELTGLFNRRGFIALAEHQLKIARRRNDAVLLHSVDMDYLKWINDTLGHREGDLALIEMADMLRDNFRQSDIIARIGGDEFVILQLEKVDAESFLPADRIQEKLNILNSKSRRRYKLSISIGTVRCEPQCNSSLEELIAQADKLMYENKRSKPGY